MVLKKHHSFKQNSSCSHLKKCVKQTRIDKESPEKKKRMNVFQNCSPSSACKSTKRGAKSGALRTEGGQKEKKEKKKREIAWHGFVKKRKGKRKRNMTKKTNRREEKREGRKVIGRYGLMKEERGRCFILKVPDCCSNDKRIEARRIERKNGA